MKIDLKDVYKLEKLKVYTIDDEARWLVIANPAPNIPFQWIVGTMFQRDGVCTVICTRSFSCLEAARVAYRKALRSAIKSSCVFK